MIEEVSSKLKARRQELGYTIEEVVEKTKLYPSVIRDLEEGNLSNLNQAYLKGFIRIYASFLGLNAAELTKDISVQNLKPKEEKKNKVTAPRQILPKISFTAKSIPPRVRQAVIVAFLALIALFIVIKVGGFIIHKVSQFSKRAAKKNEQPVSAQRKKIPVTKEKDIFKEALPKTAKEIPAKEVFSKETVVKEITVSLTAKRTCFLRVRVDGKTLLEGKVEKGKVETWKGKKEIELKISDGSAIYLEVNGKPIPSLTSSRKAIKSLKINASGIAVVK